jgi:hypothetical protein
VLIAGSNAYSQAPLPSPSPAPTPISKTGSILINSPSTVGRITKWVGSSNNGTGTIGDSVITESSIGTIGIGTNPFSDFKLAVDGGSLGGLFGHSTSGTGVFGQSNTGWAGFFQGNVNTTGLFSTGNLLLNPGGTLKFADGTIQSTAFTGQINQSQVINLIPSLAAKANDSGVVHISGTETITGAKTFSGFQLFSGNLGIGMHGPTVDTLLNVGGNTGVVAGTFINNHNTSVNDALYAVHTGRGNAFHALNTQVIGRAGFFENSHTSSSSPVLETLGHGSGPAFKASNTGTGLAGLFDGSVTINGNLTLNGSSNIALNVSHDSTLSGNGTAASPLAVVSVPNGVVTTGNYANPSWITSLDGSKVTGAVSNATNTTNAAIADTVKVPLALGGTNNLLSLTGGGGVPTLIINNTETGGGAGIQSTIDGVGNAILAYNNGNGAAVHAESFGGEPTIKGISKTANGGAGVYGLSSIASGIGVFGENNGNGAGVYGRSNGSGNALEGHSLDANGNALYARNHAGGSAGLFDGNVTINGNLTLNGSSNISTSVSHDPTLAGNGSIGSPLTVVNVPNGVVTTGSYANPSWITSLIAGKITGKVASASNADTVTNGVVTTGNYANPSWITSLAGSKISGPIFSRATTNNDVVTGLNDGSGTGVYGFSTAGYGLHGRTNSNVMAGVYGRNPVGTAGLFEGVTGLLGRADPENNFFGMPSYGVRGESTTGIGVSGSGGIGVRGDSNSPSGHGVMGTNTGGGNAGFFDGKVTINGSLNATSVNAGNLVNGVNGLSGTVTLAAGDNVTITPAGNTLTISASGSGSLADGSVTTAKIADGAVTADKLAAGIGPLRIVDNLGNEVGVLQGTVATNIYFDNEDVSAVRYIPTLNRWYVFKVTPSGFVHSNVALLHEAENCVGPGYLEKVLVDRLNDNSKFTSVAVVDFDNFYYGGTSSQVRNLRSFSFLQGTTTQCHNYSSDGYPNGHDLEVAVPLSFPLSSLGLTAPFKVAR